MSDTICWTVGAFVMGVLVGWRTYWPLHGAMREEDWRIKQVTEDMVRRHRGKR